MSKTYQWIVAIVAIGAAIGLIMLANRVGNLTKRVTALEKK